MTNTRKQYFPQCNDALGVISYNIAQHIAEVYSRPVRRGVIVAGDTKLELMIRELAEEIKRSAIEP